MAVLKMKHYDKKEIIIDFPKDPVAATLRNEVEIRLCLNGFGAPNGVKIFVNDIPQVAASEFRPPSEENKKNGCELPLSYPVSLTTGLNVIRLEVMDSRNYSFEKQISLYSLPRYDF